MTTLLPGETLAASLAEKVSETWQKINTRRNQQEAITPGWVLQSLGLNLAQLNCEEPFLSWSGGYPISSVHGMAKA
ncbi:hypothetical protein ACKU2E_027310 [Klebsiella pneumoniae]